MPALFIIFQVLNILDGVLTWYGVKNGFLREVNPPVIFIINQFGLGLGLIILKTSVLLATYIISDFLYKSELLILIVFYGAIVSYQVVVLLAVSF